MKYTIHGRYGIQAMTMKRPEGPIIEPPFLVTRKGIHVCDPLYITDDWGEALDWAFDMLAEEPDSWHSAWIFEGKLPRVCLQIMYETELGSLRKKGPLIASYV